MHVGGGDSGEEAGQPPLRRWPLKEAGLIRRWPHKKVHSPNKEGGLIRRCIAPIRKVAS